MNLNGRILGVLSILAGCAMIPIGLAQLLAEGPHGPGGQITGDPGAPVRLLACGIAAVVLIRLGIWFLAKTDKSKR